MTVATNGILAEVHDRIPMPLTARWTVLGDTGRTDCPAGGFVRSALSFSAISAREANGFYSKIRRSPRNARGLKSLGRPRFSLRAPPSARRA